MANILERQITEEGPRNAVVKFVGVLDTSDFVWAPAASLTDFTNNEVRCNLVGFRIDLLEWSMTQGIEIQVEWNSANPQQMFPLAGRGRIASDNYGGFLPDQTRPGFDGGINLRSQGYSPGTVANFSIVLELVKLYKV